MIWSSDGLKVDDFCIVNALLDGLMMDGRVWDTVLDGHGIGAMMFVLK
jgi:hypothetical protein